MDQDGLSVKSSSRYGRSSGNRGGQYTYFPMSADLGGGVRFVPILAAQPTSPRSRVWPIRLTAPSNWAIPVRWPKNIRLNGQRRAEKVINSLESAILPHIEARGDQGHDFPSYELSPPLFSMALITALTAKVTAKTSTESSILNAFPMILMLWFLLFNDRHSADRPV